MKWGTIWHSPTLSTELQDFQLLLEVNLLLEIQTTPPMVEEELIAEQLAIAFAIQKQTSLATVGDVLTEALSEILTEMLIAQMEHCT